MRQTGSWKDSSAHVQEHSAIKMWSMVTDVMTGGHTHQGGEKSDSDHLLNNQQWDDDGGCQEACAGQRMIRECHKHMSIITVYVNG